MACPAELVDPRSTARTVLAHQPVDEPFRVLDVGRDGVASQARGAELGLVGVQGLAKLFLVQLH
jgi:hypothetical protein